MRNFMGLLIFCVACLPSNKDECSTEQDGDSDGLNDYIEADLGK